MRIGYKLAWLGWSLFGQGLYFPPVEDTTWARVSPAALGWCQPALDSLLDFVGSTRTKAFLILQDGQLAVEAYFGGFGRDSLWYWASAGKTLTAFLIGKAQEEGYLRLTDTVARFLGVGWTSCPPEKERLITLWHQLTMTTGLSDQVPDPDCTDPACLVCWADAGTRWAYHNAPYTLLHRVLEQATGLSTQAYYASRVGSRIGMRGLWVPVGYNKIFFSDARSMARFGLLLLAKGVWNGDTLLRDTAYLGQMTRPSQPLNPSYGYLTWLNGQSAFMLPGLQVVFSGSLTPSAPPDMYAAIGKNAQVLCVVPSQRLVLVRLGEAPDSGGAVPIRYVEELWQRLKRVFCLAAGLESPTPLLSFQVFPSPASETITVAFRLAQSGSVTLRAYDLYGRQVVTLVEGPLPAGMHRFKWDVSQVPAGWYGLHLQTATGSERRWVYVLR